MRLEVLLSLIGLLIEFDWIGFLRLINALAIRCAVGGGISHWLTTFPLERYHFDLAPPEVFAHTTWSSV